MQISLGNLARSVMFGFTQPYMFDRPLQFGVQRVRQQDQLQPGAAAFHLQRPEPESAQCGAAEPAELFAVERRFTTSMSYPLRRSFKRWELRIRWTGRRCCP
jgi:outer membrane protein insertion porin family